MKLEMDTGDGWTTLNTLAGSFKQYLKLRKKLQDQMFSWSFLAAYANARFRITEERASAERALI